MSTINIYQAKIETDVNGVRELFWEYLTWANDMNDQILGLRLDITAMLEEDMEKLGKFMPPKGRLLLSEFDGNVIGCICLKELEPDVGEIKRLFVKAKYREKGIGSLLAKTLLKEVHEIGYQTIRLDSAKYMTKAHNLYRAHGFREIEPYLESEIPEEYHQHWVFMEKKV